MGLFHEFVDDEDVRMIGVEAGEPHGLCLGCQDNCEVPVQKAVAGSSPQAG
jgi:tryptophan synthase beta subunit